MNDIARFLVSLVAGVAAFVAVSLGVTAVLSPYVEFSLLVGLPMGLVAGVGAIFVAFAILWSRDREREVGRTNATVGAFWAAIAVVLDFAFVTVVGGLVYAFVGGSTGLAVLIFALPLTMLVAAVVGYLAGTAIRDDDGAGPRSTTP